jgi:hypothetical protein
MKNIAKYEERYRYVLGRNVGGGPALQLRVLSSPNFVVNTLLFGM